MWSPVVRTRLTIEKSLVIRVRLVLGAIVCATAVVGGAAADALSSSSRRAPAHGGGIVFASDLGRLFVANVDGTGFRPLTSGAADQPAIVDCKGGKGQAVLSWTRRDNFGLEGDRHWPGIATALGLEHVRDDPRFATMEGRRDHAEEVIATLQERFGSSTRADWGQRLDAAGVSKAQVFNCDAHASPP